MRISDWSSDVCSSDLLAEDEIDEVHRRLDRIIAELSPDYPAMTSDLRHGLLIKPLTAMNNLMTRASRHGGVEATDFVARLLLTVAGIADLKLIVIDPRSDAHLSELQSLMRNSYSTFGF